MSQISIRNAIFAALVSLAGFTGLARAGEPILADTGTSSDVGGGDSVIGEFAPDISADIPDPANLMTGLDLLGVGKPLRNLGVNVSGHVEGGYTYQFFQHPNNNIGVLQLDYSQNRPILNQATLDIERVIPVKTDTFNFGFRVQLLEGTDAQFTNSFRAYRVNPLNGLPNATDFLFDVGGNNSAYQFDIPDAYIDIGIPLGRGLRVRAGRFEFFKPIDANQRIFYSTTLVYNNALPYTNTGVTVAYDFTDGDGIELGFSRGYNITVDDDNGAVDFIYKGHARLTKTTGLVITGSVGPELPQKFAQIPTVPTPSADAYTALVDMAVDQKLSSQATLVADAVYSRQFGSGLVSGYNPFFYAAGDVPVIRLPAQYYGVSGTLVYEINSYLSLAARAEWLRDDGGILSGTTRSLYETTLGATITPFPKNAIGQNFKFRPEVRYDYSNRAIYGPASITQTPTRKDQLTFGVDAIYNF